MLCRLSGKPWCSCLQRWSTQAYRKRRCQTQLFINRSLSANRIHGAELLTALIHATERLVKPYALSLLRVLLPKASDPQPTVARLMIECIGLLSVVGCEELKPHLPEIMTVLLTALKDPQCQPKKRDAALVTMGQVCANTAHVIDPLLEHPELYAIFMRLLKTDTFPETKREVLRVMGILGALDPFVRRKVRHNLSCS
jgi:FKBP12-rapamycin complex-associated protein